MGNCKRVFPIYSHVASSVFAVCGRKLGFPFLVCSYRPFHLRFRQYLELFQEQKGDFFACLRCKGKKINCADSANAFCAKQRFPALFKLSADTNETRSSSPPALLPFDPGNESRKMADETTNTEPLQKYTLFPITGSNSGALGTQTSPLFHCVSVEAQKRSSNVKAGEF